MSFKYIGKDSIPTYLALSTDIEDNATIPGCNIIGKTVYLTDTSQYKLILPNLKLIPFAFSNGTSGTLPEYDSSEIGTVDASTVVVTFNENISAADYALGVTIKVNDVVQTITSATRQTNHALVYYVIDTTVVSTDVVTWEYNQSAGGIVSETGTVYLDDVSAQVVTNNVAP